MNTYADSWYILTE